jgi:hypothetical protein
MYFNFTVKNNSSNNNKNMQFRWEVNAKHRSWLDLLKDLFLVKSSYNNNNDDFKKMIKGRQRKKMLAVW